MSTIDLDLSRAVAAATKPRPRDGRCFLNSFRAFGPAKELLGESPLYVEGVAQGELGVRCHHAWLESADGRIIDVTPSWLGASVPAEYQAVRKLTITEVLTHLNQRGANLPVGGETGIATETAESE